MRRRGDRWTPAKDALLRRLGGTMPLEELAAQWPRLAGVMTSRELHQIAERLMDDADLLARGVEADSAGALTAG